MLFTEPAFLFYFLPLLLAVYFSPLTRGELRNHTLLAASLVFYAWGDKNLVLVLFASILCNHYFAKLIQSRQTRDQLKWLTLGISGNVLFLTVFKYANFIISNVNYCLVSVDFQFPQTNIGLPIGISFFTFQAISYLIDVYRSEAKAQDKLSRTALYISLFPQLIAGPIVRYTDIAKDLDRRTNSVTDVAWGIRRFITGLSKKTIVADSLARVVDQIFGISGSAEFPGVPIESVTPSLAWLAVVCYSLQIYFDFSGYSDMAIGLGRIFGFRFLENFNHPYCATSITDFWRRWHISLSSWFRDYLYIPLGGNRGTTTQTYRNLLLVFLLCGLWHGASWTFIAWGLFHGTFLIIERSFLSSILKNIWAPFKHTYVLFIVAISWTLFRSESFQQAISFVAALCGQPANNPDAYPASLYINNQVVLCIALGIFFSTPSCEKIKCELSRWTETQENSTQKTLASCFSVIVFFSWLSILILSASQIASNTYSPFIYFRF